MTNPAYMRTMRVAISDERRPYRGLMDESFDWIRNSTSGPKNLAKLVYHGVDWAKQWFQYNNTALPADVRNGGELAREFKRAFGIIDLPQAVSSAVNGTRAVIRGPQPLVNQQGEYISRGGRQLAAGEEPVYTTSRLDLCRQAALNFAGIASPLEDAVSVLNARKVVEVAPETMKVLGRVAAVALLFSMGNAAIEDGRRVWEALKLVSPGADEFEQSVRWRLLGQSREEIAAAEPMYDIRVGVPNRVWMVIELNLIDLAKCVSYVALASISLYSAFIATIATASFWILVTSTSALAFTIIGEFRHRVYRTENPNYPQLPDVLERRPRELARGYADREQAAAAGGRRLRWPGGSLPSDAVDIVGEDSDSDEAEG